MKKHFFLIVFISAVLLQTYAAPVITEAEKEGLLLMREEEKLARDVYLTLYEKTGIKAFSNIARSEQQHMDAVKSLLDQFGVKDPVTSDERGVFVNPELSAHYKTMTAAETDLDAVKQGALIEDLDIYDLKRLMNETENRDILSVYENLLRGSRNHLRAFNRQLLKYGGSSWKAQFTEQSEIDAILNGNQERGPGH